MTSTDDLAATFRDSLTTKLKTLLLAQQNLAGAFAESAASIRRIAHRLKGTGTTFGFPEVTAAALAVMNASDASLPAATDALVRSLESAVVVTGDSTKTNTAILIIDDDPNFRRLLETILAEPGRQIFSAATPGEAESVIAGQLLAMIILDLMLENTDGRSLLLRLRENPHTATVPIIVVSGKTNPAIKAECFALGADGYFEKPIEPQVLESAVTARLKQARRAVREARTDGLTGLPNRTAFNEAFTQAAAMARRTGEPLAVAIMDLDNFKKVNDTYGHAAGDDVLKRLAAEIPRALRQTDLLARWGGEEFVLFFPATGAHDAANVLDQARLAFKAIVFATTDGKQFSVSFSAGVAAAEPATSAADAVDEADRWLYLAKEAGRDRVVSPATDPVQPTRHRIMLAEDDHLIAELIDHLLAREGFEVKWFSDGAAAAAALAEPEFALALLDVQLPGQDGFNLLQQLRRHPRGGNLPVMMLTALGGEQHLTRGFALGADDYLVKPFSPTELLARIRRLLKRR